MPLHKLRRTGNSIPPVLTYITSSGNASNTATPSYSSISIGTASTDRLVVVLVESAIFGAGSANPVTGGTIAGVTATIHTGTSSTAGGSNLVSIAMMSAIVPTGTTGTISVTFANINSCCQIHVYTITGYSSLTPTIYTDVEPTGTPVVAVTGSHPVSVAICGAVNAALTRTYVVTTSGSGAITEDADVSPRSGCGTVAASLRGAEGSPNITFTPSGSTSNNAAMVAVWR